LQTHGMRSVKINLDRQCTYNVTLRRVLATIVVVENNNYYFFCVCVCRLRYPACNEHAPYSHLWPAALYNIFPRYIINVTISYKKLLNLKCVFWFSLQLLSVTFLMVRRTERSTIRNVYWSSCKVLVILFRY
jgi:hypothetical protein